MLRSTNTGRRCSMFGSGMCKTMAWVKTVDIAMDRIEGEDGLVLGIGRYFG